jgi:CheY-like chemotaxis protein
MPHEKIHIFYTDDDKDDIAIFEDAAAEADKEIKLIANFNGGDLIDLLNNPPPEPAMVFLDWNMPGKNGEEVLAEIRATESLRDIPILIFSTSSNADNIESARRNGANMYITKPNTFQDIVQIIRHCLKIDWKNFKDPHKFVYRPN